MTERLSDSFIEPTQFQRFNIRNDTPLPAGIGLSDFTVYSVTEKDRQIMPIPRLDQSYNGFIDFQNELFVVFDERPMGTLLKIDDTSDPIRYKNTEGLWVPGEHLHLEINNVVEGFFWVGARWTPSIEKIIDQTATAWWWLYTLRDPEIPYPGGFIRGGYIFEKEEDAVCVRAALDVK